MTFLMILLIVGLIAVLLFGIIMYKHAKKRQNIPRLETEGILTKVTMTQYKGEDSSFCIEYRVNDKKYTAILSSLGAKNMTKQTPIGTKVTVLYNPDNPQDAYAELRDFNQVSN